MKILVLSDLHLECKPVEIRPPPCDMVILAGDTNLRDRGLAWAKEAFPDRTVIYIAGNHEYYGEEFPGLIGKLQAQAAGSRVAVLENEWLEESGYRFFGCTLWTDMELLGDAAGCSARAELMNDYRQIRHSHSYAALKPDDTRLQHELSVNALEAFLAEGDPRRSVIVTHHAPSELSVPLGRRGDPLSPAYASRLDALIARTRPLLWIHGHIHLNQRYRIGETTVLANPRGYFNQLEGKFDPGLVVDLEELRQGGRI